MQHGLKVVTVDHNAHVPLQPLVEALHPAVDARRVGSRHVVRHAGPLTGVLGGVGGEAGAAVGQHVCDPEGQGGDRLVGEGHRRGGDFVVLELGVDEARGTVDGDVKEAPAVVPSRLRNLGRCFHFNVDEADLVVLEGATRLADLLGGQQAVQPVSLGDAAYRVPV